MSTHEQIMISASAGSGKTYRLMELVALGVTDQMPPSGLIASTFTVKAAGELKERIREKLVDEGRVAEARMMDLALIGTVHSVCSELLSRFAFEQGASLKQEILVDEEKSRFFREALNEALTDSDRKNMGRWADRFGMEPKDFEQRIEQIVDLARQNDLGSDGLTTSLQASLHLLEEALPPVKHQDCTETLRSALTAFFKENPGPRDETDATKKAYEAASDAHRTLSKQGGGLSWPAWIKLTKLKPGAKSRTAFAGVIDAAKLALQSGELRQDLSEATRFVFQAAGKAMLLYSKKKEALGRLDYSDLEQRTLRLLDLPEVRARLSSELHTLMIDEFQDTNPVQLAIFQKLGSLCKKTVWVGDLKQSIYGFRGADPGLMSDAMKAALVRAGKDTPEILLSTWRSSAAIVQFNNRVFAQAFKDDGIAADQITQIPKWPHQIEGPGIEVWCPEGKNAGVRAASLARGVAKLLQSGALVVDRETKVKRAIRAGDIAILARIGEHVADISNALNAEGLATAVAGGALLHQSEVVLALSAFRFLINPRDRIAAGELALGLGVDPHLFLSRMIEDAKVGELHPALQLLEDSRKHTRDFGIREKLELAIAVAGLDDLSARMMDGESRLFHLSALRQLAIRYEEHCRASLIPCTEPGFLEFLSEEEPEIPAAAHPGAVNVMTYHASKGLEWPVVILGSLNTKPQSATLFEPRAELAPGASFDPDAPLKSRVIRDLIWPFGRNEKIEDLDQHLALSATLKARTAARSAEIRRILYVGMTRAKEKLVLLNENMTVPSEDTLLGSLRHEGGSLFEFAGGDTLKVSGVNVPVKWVNLATPVEGVDGGSDFRSSKVRALQALMATASSDAQALYLQPSKISKKAFAGSGALQDRSNAIELYEFGRDLLLNRSVKLEEDEASVRRDELGTAVHLFLGSDQSSDSKDQRTARALSIIEKYAIRSKLDPDALVASSDRFFQFVKDRWPHGQLFREVPIEFGMNGSFVRGSMDALVLTPTEAVIVDHKASEARAGEAQELVEVYQHQLRAYAEAVGRAYPNHKVRTFLHNPDGWVVEVERA